MRFVARLPGVDGSALGRLGRLDTERGEWYE